MRGLLRNPIVFYGLLILAAWAVYHVYTQHQASVAAASKGKGGGKGGGKQPASSMTG